MNIIKEEFGTINELLTTIHNRKVNYIFENACLSSEKIDETGWTGTRTYDESIELLRFGYIEILDNIKERLNVPVRSADNKRIPKNDIIGFLPNVPNAIQGLPNSMINFKHKREKVKVINLLYSPVANYLTDANTFVTSGVKILNVINNLELNGIRVNLKIAYKYSRCGDETTLATVTIKKDTEQLNLRKICYPIAHPGMLRRIGFKWLETSPQIKNPEWTGGYGCSIMDNNTHDKIEKLMNNTKLISLNYAKEHGEQEILNKVLS